MTDKHRNEAISNALKRRIKKFSRIEKVFYGAIILTAITMAVSIIYLQSRKSTSATKKSQISIVR